MTRLYRGMTKYEDLSRAEQAILVGIAEDIDGFCAAYDSLVAKGLLTEDGDETQLADMLVDRAIDRGLLLQSKYGGNRSRP